jgi:adenylate kinase family enzyme
MDGFPRTVNQARLFDQFLESKSTKIDLVLNLHASIDEVLMRLSGA